MAVESSAAKVLFERDGVLARPSGREDAEDDFPVCGSLRIVQKDADVSVEFTPLEDSADILCAAEDSSSVVEWVRRGGRRPGEPRGREAERDAGGGEGSARRDRFFSVRLAHLAAVTVREDRRRDAPSLLFALKDSSSLPPLHFQQGGGRELLDCLRRMATLSPCAEDESRLLIGPADKVLSESFENLADDGDDDLGPVRFRKDPYVTTLGRFSKVGNYIFDAFRGSEEQHQRPPEEEEVAAAAGELIPALEINQQEEPGFEVVTRVDLGTRPQVSRGAPISALAWSGHQDQDGRLLRVARLKESIFRGGLCHAVRKEAWKFLLGYFPWSSTLDERRSLQRSKTDEYFRMKLQWKSVSEEQEKRNWRLREYRSLIEKDVERTDRSNPFYQGTDNPGLVLLHDILMTYCMYDFDLGYVQGMSDLLSPIVFVLESEADAFWCFVSFMEQLVSGRRARPTGAALFFLPRSPLLQHRNFEEQMQGMKAQLIQLSSLLRLLDPSFCNYLESQDSGYLYFCFRWLLIRFKREFAFHDVLRLWEVMWTGLPCHNFHLLLCCAILDSERSKIMEEKFGFNEILKHVNQLSMKLDVEEILQKAESIWLQIKKCQGWPRSALDILVSDSCRRASACRPADSEGHSRCAVDSRRPGPVAFTS
ncbi:TBC1 domain family member 15 isoform X2 [Corythoichthys intestinalis]|uniref:TBC1 domain family member 15 isoform X2 n=1 Tax=Corythoichthys intestinalis TaxID=161448 RepID=UPI0025A5CC6E|nr:TBC1 domain family member 15 isoform X2 [Corythoichthys intestinalis]